MKIKIESMHDVAEIIESLNEFITKHGKCNPRTCPLAVRCEQYTEHDENPANLVFCDAILEITKCMKEVLD